MRTTCLLLLLLIVGSVLAVDKGRVTPFKSKESFYIDCQSNSVTLYPGATNVTWESLQRPDNAVEKLLDQIQASYKTQYVIVMARPDSVKVFRQVRKIVGGRPIDVDYDAVDAAFKVDWNEPAGQRPGAQIPPYQGADPAKTPIGSKQQPMFFECRNEQLFYVDKAELDEKVAQVLAALAPGNRSGDPSAFVKAISGKEIGNDYYKVMPSYLLAGIMALEPKPGVRGDDQALLWDDSGKFQQSLRKFDWRNQYLFFLVRGDSFSIFREARVVADHIGFDVGWELLDKDEPIKFGTGGQMVPAH